MLPTSTEDVSDILVHKLISGLRLFEKIDSKNWWVPISIAYFERLRLKSPAFWSTCKKEVQSYMVSLTGVIDSTYETAGFIWKEDFKGGGLLMFSVVIVKVLSVSVIKILRDMNQWTTCKRFCGWLRFESLMYELGEKMLRCNRASSCFVTWTYLKTFK